MLFQRGQESGVVRRGGAIGLLALCCCLAWMVTPLRAQTTQPLVAVHDSELTRALETMTASNGTPTGAGTTGNQWWPTNWHYFVMPTSVEQALQSDGTPYAVVSDANINSGALLNNGAPAYPIVISLASEAIQDSEIAQFTNYVAAGGYLFVGSSAFTRTPSGASRGDFAFANAMGIHMVNSGLTNWGINTTFTKQFNHRIVSHIPAGVLSWALPYSADETFWGSTSPHTGEQPQVYHLVWQVQPSDATVVALGDNYPYLLVKPYGKGYFIYVAAMQPIIGHSGWAPGMYAYMTFRKAIEWAFDSANLPAAKLSPWPYQYDSAFMARHDLEDYADEISNINYSAQFEAANGAKGDYYFCTGTFRVEMPTNGYPTNSVIANFKSAVTNYGATVQMHNGGLQNPNYPTMAETNFDYWHWGPDEVLSITNSITNNGIVYPNGTAYATASMSNAFSNIEGWLSGVESSNMRSWVAPYFNGTREGSFAIQSQLGVKVTGDQKDGSFPTWVFSTANPGLNYGMLNLPVSDWFLNPGQLTYVGQALESGFNQATMQSLVDFYYNNGLLINLYSHTLSASSATNGAFFGSIPGPSGPLEGQYVMYGMNTNVHPRIWGTSATNLYAWWSQRSSAQINVASTTNASGLSTTTISISGATATNTAVEVRLPSLAVASGLQVSTNGVPAGASGFRVNGQVVKILVGNTVTNAVVSYTLGPGVLGNYYSTPFGTPLNVSAPGVLANDAAGLGSGNLTAVLVNNTTNGSLTLNSDGSFNYVPSANFSGIDSFTYEANNGLDLSSPVTVTISVLPAGDLFYDNFARPAGADPLAPWQVPVGFGSWGITNGSLQGTSLTANYGYAYVSNDWTDVSVQAQIQFPVANSFGGIGGRLNPTTGTHYSAWVFPGTTNLQLLKYTSWGTFSILANVPLASSVGTNTHSLLLGFQGSQITVSYDGTQMVNLTDSSGPYLSGGVVAEMYTDGTSYTYSVDNFLVTAGSVPPVANSDSYIDTQGQTLIVPPPGVLTNDSGGSGPLSGVLVSGTSHGSLSFNSNGGFTYTPTNTFSGTDNFMYEATDGITNSAPATATITVNQAPPPVANADSYSFVPNATLTVSAPGVLGNDSDPLGSNLVANLVSGAAHGSVTLNANGSFTYVPATNFHGNDSFAYQAYDGLNTSTSATVTINDSSAGILFSDNFTRSSYPGTLSPWLVEADNWAINNGVLQGGVDPQSTYGNVYLTNNWTNYSVTAQMQFSTANAYGGGVGGRLNTNTGAHYAVWVYPEGSATSGSPLTLKLVKFTDWTHWGYDGTAFMPIASAALTSVGTNVHTLKLAFYSNQIAVYFDGSLAISATDADTANPPYSNGGVSVDMWTDPTPYILSIDNVTVSTLAVDNSYTVAGAGPLTVPSPGVLSNDTEVLGGNLAAALVSGPTNGTLNSLNPNGGFTYTPTNTAAYDSFSYQANDGTNNLGFATVSITHTLQSQTITFGSLASQTYGNAPFVLTATASSGLPVGYSISSGPATVTNGTVTLTGTGLVSVTASQAGNATYSSASNVVQSFTVNPASLTVTANNTNRLYGAANPVFTAKYTGFVNGETNTVLSGSPSLICPAVTNSPVSGYTITAAQGTLSAANYTFTFANGTLTVNPAPLMVTAKNTNRLYGATNPVFTAGFSGFVNGENSGVLGGSPSLTCPATTNSPVGGYTITAGHGTISDANYSYSFVNGTLTVGKASLLVTANNANRPYGTANPVFTASYSGFLGTDTVSVVSGSPSLTCPAVTNSPTGSYTITTAQGTLSALNYNFSFANGTLSVGQATLLVAADNLSRQYETTNPVLTYSISGFLGTDTVSVVSGTAAISTAAVTNSPVGSYPITVTNGTLTASNYVFSFTNGTLTVGAAPLLVSADNQNRLYGATNPVLTYSFNGFVGTDTVGVVSGTAAISTVAVTNSPVGGYPIMVTNGTLVATNYSLSFTNGTLTVNPAPLVVTANNAGRLYGLANPVFTAGYSGFVNGENSGVLGGSPSLTCPATTNSPVGGYTIAAGQGTISDANYSYSFVNGTLTVSQAALLVAADNQNRPYEATNPVLTYTISGFLGTDTVSVVSGTAAISTTAVTNSPVGVYPITVTNGTLSALNYNFNFANGTLSVGQAVLLVSANNLGRQYETTNPVLTYSISGFLGTDTVSVVSGTPAISTTAVTNSPVGTYPISVTNGTLSTADYVFSFTNGTLTVGAATLLVAANNQGQSYGSTSPALTYNISGFLGTDTVGVVTGTAAISTAVVTNSPVGLYPIVVTNGTLAATNYDFSFTNGTLTVNPAPLVVTANNAGRKYGLANPVFTANYSGFVNGESNGLLGGSPSLTCPATTNSQVGGYTITAGRGTMSDANYSYGFVNGTLTVGQATLLVTADNQNRPYGVTNPVLTYSIGGFLGTDTVSVVSGTAATSTPAVTNSPAGVYPIIMTNGTLSALNYNFSFANGTLSVGQATLLVAADNLSRQYETTNPVLTYSISGFLGTDTVSVVSGTAAISTAAVTNSPVGSYPITVTNGTLTASNYVFSFTNGTLTVGAAPLLVSADNQNRLYGATNPVLTYSFNGFVGTDTVGVVSGTAAISTVAVTNSPVGGYPIMVTNGTLVATNYSLSFTNGTLTVNPAPLVVTANNAGRLYGLANPVFTAGYSGFVNGENSGVLGGSPSLTCPATTNSPVGGYTIAAGQGTISDTNYSCSFVNGTLTVSQAALLVEANSQNRPYETANPVLTYTISGFLGTDTVSVVSGTAAISTTALTNSPVGVYPITVINGTLSAANYNFGFANGSLTVGPATLQVIADDQSRLYGATNPVLTYSISGFLGTDTVSVVSGTPGVSTSATTTSPVGEYAITVTDGTLSAMNYNFTPLNGTLTVLATGPTILKVTPAGTNVVVTWTALSNATYRLQYLPAFPGTNWQSIVPDVTATNAAASAVDSPGTVTQRYYRVMVVP
jgi:hypothetical protein